MAFPSRTCRLITLVGRSSSAISAIVQYVVQFLAARFGALIYFDKQRLQDNLNRFSKAVADAGAPLTNCWGFLDGTARKCARPVRGQKVMYSGHKRSHCFKYQSVVTPDGIISHLFGPIAGRHHDMHVLGQSQLLKILAEAPFKDFLLYGDPGYTCADGLTCPCKGSDIDPVEQLFNSRMSSVRISVEWGFGRVTNLWAFLNYAPQQRALQSPIASYYKVAILLTNVRTILDEGNIISTKFNLSPPTLQSYLHI